MHAGRGIPALGAHVLEFAEEFPRARFILAHCAVSDLAWIWQRIHEYPNVFFDTSWFSATDQLAVYSHIPPGQILFATDIPFGTPQLAVIGSLRCALQAGLTPAQLESVMGGQLARIVARAGDARTSARPSATGASAATRCSRAWSTSPTARSRRRSPAATTPSSSTSRAWPASSATARRRRRWPSRSASCSRSR